MNKLDIKYCYHWQMNTHPFAKTMLCLLYLMQPTSATTQPNMMTSSNGNIFRVTGLLCGEFTGHRWIPRTKACDAELWCFDLCLNQQLSKQWRRRWFETPSRSTWRHCNAWFHSAWHTLMKKYTMASMTFWIIFYRTNCGKCTLREWLLDYFLMTFKWYPFALWTILVNNKGCIDPCNFLIKCALESPQGTLVVAKALFSKKSVAIHTPR